MPTLLGQPIGSLAITQGEESALAAVRQACDYPGDVFDLSDWSDMVDEFGVWMNYYKAVICSCVAENNGHPDTNCDCYAGFRYPHNPVSVKLIRTSVDIRKMPDRLGLELQGGCHLTIPRCFKEDTEYYVNYVYDTISVGDVFVVNTRTRRDRDILQRGVRDFLHAFDVNDVLSIYQRGVKYRANVDYEVNTYKYPFPFWYVGFKTETDLNKGKFNIGGEIDWLAGGDSPEVNEFYSVEFLSKMQYIVWSDLAKDRGTENDQLPKHVICKLRQFINFGESQLDLINV